MMLDLSLTVLPAPTEGINELNELSSALVLCNCFSVYSFMPAVQIYADVAK